MKKIVWFFPIIILMGGCANESDTSSTMMDTDGETEELMLDIVFEQMSPSEVAELCDAFDFLGPELSYRQFSKGFDDPDVRPPTMEQFVRHFEEEC
jgi:hypothetical protein